MQKIEEGEEWFEVSLPAAQLVCLSPAETSAIAVLVAKAARKESFKVNFATPEGSGFIPHVMVDEREGKSG